jgi:hypothetical protein
MQEISHRCYFYISFLNISFSMIDEFFFQVFRQTGYTPSRTSALIKHCIFTEIVANEPNVDHCIVYQEEYISIMSIRANIFFSI